MTLVTLALVLSSAVLHATWNLWTKQIGREAGSAALMWTLTAISTLLYAPVALAMFAGGGWRPEPGALVWILGSAVIHVGYFLLLIRGYRAGDLSLVYPVARGTGPLLAALGAMVWFGERPTVLSVAGIAFVVLGLFVLTARPAASGGRKIEAGLGYGLAIGAFIALYTLWDGWSVKRIGIPPLLFYWSGEVVRLLLFTPAAAARREEVARLWKDHRARVMGIAALSPLSYILILLALRSGAISHIAPARELSILVGAYLGGRVLGEGERTRRLAAAAAFACGVIALAMA